MTKIDKKITSELLDYASKILGDEETARYWLHTPKKALGGRIPMDVVYNFEGLQSVRNLLGRIEHGIFS
tara:strand:+ start:346 stop:552 length:207 start_codon:yes stop_codon:yes gene_type:complete